MQVTPWGTFSNFSRPAFFGPVNRVQLNSSVRDAHRDLKIMQFYYEQLTQRIDSIELDDVYLPPILNDQIVQLKENQSRLAERIQKQKRYL